MSHLLLPARADAWHTYVHTITAQLPAHGDPSDVSVIHQSALHKLHRQQHHMHTRKRKLQA